MARTLQSSSDASAQATKELAEFLRRAREAMDTQLVTLTEMVRTTASESRDAVRSHLDVAGHALAEGSHKQVAALDSGVRGLEAATATWRELLGQTGMLVSKAGDTAKAFSGTGAQLDSISDNLQRAAQAMAGAQAQLVQQADSSNQALVAVRASAQAIEATLEKTTTVWAQYGERFAGIDAALAQSFRELDDGLTRYAERVRSYLTDVDTSLGKATEHLGSVVSPLSEDLQDLPGQVKQFADQVEKLRVSLEQTESRHRATT